MKLIKPSFEIWEQGNDLDSIYRHIERAGRICYRSENKIAGDSAKPFVDRMIKSNHGAVLEHGTVYLVIPYDYVDVSSKLEIPIVSDVVEKYKRNPYTKWWLRDDIFSRLAFITTNMRVLVENNWLDDLKYQCEPTECHEKRITVHFICDRGILAEFTRHRVFSFSAESTRYCNYSKNKFGNEVTFIEPCWPTTEPMRDGFSEFRTALAEAENHYLFLIENGWKPQQARAVLPNALKTELVMTGFVSDWKHFFELRDDNSAHPQAQELAHPLHEEFVKRGYIVDNK